MFVDHLLWNWSTTFSLVNVRTKKNYGNNYDIILFVPFCQIILLCMYITISDIGDDQFLFGIVSEAYEAAMYSMAHLNRNGAKLMHKYGKLRVRTDYEQILHANLFHS